MQVGHVLSIQFEDNYVVWSDTNYYYSWHFAKKAMFNCIIQPINSWIKLLVKLLSSALQCNNPHHGKPYQDTITRIYLRELPKKLKQILFRLYKIMQCEIL